MPQNTNTDADYRLSIMSKEDSPTYSEGTEVVFQLSPGHTADAEDLDSEGMLRRSGVIVETPEYDETFAGKPVRFKSQYKIQEKPGVYGHVPEEQIIARVGEYSGEPCQRPWVG